MKNNQCINKNSISFGWYYPMHSTITKNAIKGNICPKIEKILLESVKKPDLEEFFLVGQKHFYYPNDRIKSYLDYTGTHNAKYMYKMHLKNALKGLRNNNTETGMDEAGRALHYLQDMTQPNHIDSGSIIKKAKEAKMPHNRFEMNAFEKQDTFYQNHTPIKITANSFNKLFEEIVNLSQKNDIPKKSNIENWANITQNAIDLSISATKKFLELLSNAFTY